MHPCYSELQVGYPNVKHKLTAIKNLHLLRKSHTSIQEQFDCNKKLHLLRKSHTSIQEQPQVYTALLDFASYIGQPTCNSL